jgi:type II secretory pathway predicted ATPase ExeA
MHAPAVGKIDEAHLLDQAQMEAVRLLTLCRGGGYAEAAVVARGSPCQATQDRPGHSA